MQFLGKSYHSLAGPIGAELKHLRIRPIHSMGFLTYRCTSRCRTCTIWKRNADASGDELSKDEWLLVMDRLHRGGVKDFELFGGDALLREDAIFDVVRFCTGHGMETFFPTNSLICDRATIEKLVDAGLGTIYISLDDIGEENDGIRGVDGTFEKVKETIETFLEVRGSNCTPKIIICSTLSSLNYKNFPKLVEFLDSYKIDAIYPRPLGEFSAENVAASCIDDLEAEPYFMPSDGQSHLLTSAQYAELDEIFSQYKGRRNGVYVNLHAHYYATRETYTAGVYPLKHCHVATTLVTINPNGDVVPCPFFRNYSIGNLVQQELSEIWGNEKHRKFIQRQQCGDLPICKNCNMRVYYPSLLEKGEYFLRRSWEKVGLMVG